VSAVLSLRNIYWGPSGHRFKELLRNINLDLRTHEILVVKGPPSSGKTKLLQISGMRVEPTTGMVVFRDQLKISQSLFRRSSSYYLGNGSFDDEITLYDNISVIMRVTGTPEKLIHDRVSHVLKLTGLIDKRDVRAGELSEYEHKTAFIAMSLARESELVICDFNLRNSEYDIRLVKLLEKASLRGGAVIVSAYPEFELYLENLRYIDISDGSII
jgi:ABC-type multidrug transport system ATPase subunit